MSPCLSRDISADVNIVMRRGESGTPYVRRRPVPRKGRERTSYDRRRREADRRQFVRTCPRETFISVVY